MKTIQMPVPKRAIQELSGDELDLLKNFGKSKEFEVLKKLSEMEKYHRYKTDFLVASSTEEINMVRGISIGIDFIMDSVERAKQELKARGDREVEEDEIDKE